MGWLPSFDAGDTKLTRVSRKTNFLPGLEIEPETPGPEPKLSTSPQVSYRFGTAWHGDDIAWNHAARVLPHTGVNSSVLVCHPATFYV